MHRAKAGARLQPCPPRTPDETTRPCDAASGRPARSAGGSPSPVRGLPFADLHRLRARGWPRRCPRDSRRGGADSRPPRPRGVGARRGDRGPPRKGRARPARKPDPVGASPGRRLLAGGQSPRPRPSRSRNGQAMWEAERRPAVRQTEGPRSIATKRFCAEGDRGGGRSGSHTPTSGRGVASRPLLERTSLAKRRCFR